MIAIIDYGVGNTASIRNMFTKVGVATVVTSEPNEIGRADRLVLPGVGAFDRGMENLQALGLTSTLEHAVLRERRPLLAICLGMQLLTHRSEEGGAPGFGWLDAVTLRFRPTEDAAKVPHMGWGRVVPSAGSPMFSGIDDPQFYFLHSYFVHCEEPGDIAASIEYAGVTFAAASLRGNIWATQFHPEKSHRYGMQLFRNFAAA